MNQNRFVLALLIYTTLVSPVASTNTSTSTYKHHRTGSMTSSFSEFSRKMRPKTLQMDGNKPSIYKSSSVPMNLQTDISPGKITLHVSEVNWVLWLDVVFLSRFWFPRPSSFINFRVEFYFQIWVSAFGALCCWSAHISILVKAF